MKKIVFMVCLIILLPNLGFAQLAGDQLGTHDLSPGGTSLVKGSVSSACLYCHAPHGAMTMPTPLWNQELSVQSYSMYTSSTYHQTGLQPGIGSPSKLCLSCHDGTVAVGQTVAYGKLMTSGTMKTTSMLGTDLKSSHPFSLKTPLTDSPSLNVLLTTAPARTADPAVNLINGNVECTTCHQPHFQNIDKQLPSFLVRDSSNSQLCAACHDPNRVVNGQVNALAGWPVSAHATAVHTTANKPYVGGYGTVAQNGCNSCHMPHNASGPARLLRGPDQQDCVSCHSGSNTQPLAPNIFAEMTPSGGIVRIGHPFPNATNQHDPTEGVVLNNNRHSGCVDCHNPHASQPVGTFGVPPTIRMSQASVSGVSAADGMTVVSPAINQYETCFRCHGTSAGKGSATINFGYGPVRAANSGDPLNIVPQFSLASISSHPVTHDRSSTLPQPSLRGQMLQLDGSTLGRTMGARMFCTDCHNSDDNREFGGGGPNGPHGSKFSHILERRYDMSQAVTPGAQLSNPAPNPDLSVNGPYALCAKCHDLAQVLSDSTFKHAEHVRDDGASCSVCHTAHGMGGLSTTLSGERLVNFDLNVVAPNGTTPISFNRASKTCTLTCHGEAHSNFSY